MLTQIVDERFRIERVLLAQRDAGIAQLAGVEPGRETVDLLDVERACLRVAEVSRAERGVVVDGE